MSFRLLELGRFSLISTSQALKLEVVSGVDITGAQRLVVLDDDALIKAVTSRQLWVSRGRGFRIDIEVLLDGKTLDRSIYFELLESLGCLIRDKKEWNQLFLSASLETPPDIPSVRMPHFSILLNNSTKPTEPGVGLAEWIGNIDVVPPNGVLCAQLERIQVQFNFMPTLEAAIDGVPAPSALRPASPDDILLDLPPDTLPRSTHERDSQSLDLAVQLLKTLPEQVASCFESPHTTDNQPLHIDPPPIIDLKVNSSNESVLVSAPSDGDIGSGNSSRRISEKARIVLDAWVGTHRDNLYPSMEEKEKLMVATGLKRSQLNTQLFNYRQKLKRGLLRDVQMQNLEGMLLGGQYRYDACEGGWNEGKMLLTEHIDRSNVEEHDEEMIFSQMANDETLPLSQSSSISTTSSTNTTISSTCSSYTSLVRPNLDGKSFSLKFAFTSALADEAFRTLMGAAVPKRLSRFQDFQLKSLPQVPMSTFVPSMFSPGFKNSIAGHSRFLPTISHALCVSMPQNVQTPSLRRKLFQLSSLESSQLPDPSSQSGKPGTVQRLSSVVQSRLWGMMQRKLFDKAAGRRLWRRSTPGDEDEKSDVEDMFAAVEDGNNLKMDEDNGMSEEEMLFGDDEDDDLLLDDDNDQYNADWERRAIEDKTDDMLLGDDWQQDWATAPKEIPSEESRMDMETLEESDDITQSPESDRVMLMDQIDRDIWKKLDGDIGIQCLDESANEEMLI
ncbi:hypothetical protein ONS95_003522 [Cadophora gregata]|uniref:uncharacterized protein n=1 Tax=Cadophora gregata TaxID=51156 RepID=UPI0026DB1A8C|nr:uncharacterized protein ONS95_003522 [Cadophora gregata]KAK0106800.1 hypothetical protein ONS95_003522 [Cadophora gregata]